MTDVNDLKKDVLEIKSELKAIKQRLDEIARLVSDSVDENLGWLKLAESSFAFWDNGEDAIYDGL
jgi:hypothetical protein